MMIHQEKGASNSKHKDDGMLSQSGSKNARIDDFFMNSNGKTDFSNKKRKRDTEDGSKLSYEDLNGDTKVDSSEKVKKKKNRNICSICRDGGDLLLCDNCPKSFHMTCLKLKASDIPPEKWYCPCCL